MTGWHLPPTSLHPEQAGAGGVQRRYKNLLGPEQIEQIKASPRP